jgi:hypothetical protein
VSTAVFILNRVPTKSLKGMTPFEVWFGRKPDVSFLGTFECIGHVKKTKPNLTKLEDRSTSWCSWAMRMAARPIGSTIHVEARGWSRGMWCSTKWRPGIGRIWA